MEFEVTFRADGDPADLEIDLAGVPTDEGFQLLNERLTTDRHFRAGLTILVDCSALDTAGLTNEEVQRLSEHVVQRDWDFPPAAVALVAPDAETFTKLREYKAHLGGSKSNRHLFESRAEALAWLKEQ